MGPHGFCAKQIPPPPSGTKVGFPWIPQQGWTSWHAEGKWAVTLWRTRCVGTKILHLWGLLPKIVVKMGPIKLQMFPAFGELQHHGWPPWAGVSWDWEKEGTIPGTVGSGFSFTPCSELLLQTERWFAQSEWHELEKGINCQIKLNGFSLFGGCGWINGLQLVCSGLGLRKLEICTLEPSLVFKVKIEPRQKGWRKQPFLDKNKSMTELTEPRNPKKPIMSPAKQTLSFVWEHT